MAAMANCRCFNMAQVEDRKLLLFYLERPDYVECSYDGDNDTKLI